MITLTQGSLSVQLRDPDFGNANSIEVRRINRKTRGGELLVFRDPMWPRDKVLKFKFSYLGADDLSRLLNFVHRTLGQIVTIADHEGRSWDGIITTPGDEVAQEGRENFIAQFTFQVQL